MNTSRIVCLPLAAAALVTIFACTDSSGPNDPTMRDKTPSEERSQVAQDKLAALFPDISAEVLALPGTVYGDYDETAGKLVFAVENANAISGVEHALQARGLSASQYVIRESKPIVPVTTLQDRFRPTQAGIQIHFGMYLCSLGFNADFNGVRSMITASHCTNKQGGVEGTTYAQPLRSVDPTVIATEVSDPEYTALPGCSKGKVCRYSDASRAEYSADVASDRGIIAKTTGVNNGSLDVSGTISVAAQDNSDTTFTGSIDKIGRTTGWTRGTAGATCATVNVSGSKIQLLCQTLVNNSSAAIVGAGDSGSGVFKYDSGAGTATLIGILWGGGGSSTFVFSPLKNVQYELGGLVATQSGSGGGSGGGGGGGGGGCIPHGKGNNCR